MTTAFSCGTSSTLRLFPTSTLILDRAGYQTVGLLGPGEGAHLDSEAGAPAGTLKAMRLFAALPLPQAAVERLTRLRLRLSAPRDGLRWSEPEQWHITLQFYGEVSEAVALCVGAQLAQVVAPAPSLALDGLGLFHAKGILFASIEPSRALTDLHAELCERSQACGLLPESRPFRPHITLARSKGKAGHRSLQQLSKPALPAFGAPIRWVGHECLLLESVLLPQGAQYLLRSRVALAKSNGSQGRSE